MSDREAQELIRMAESNWHMDLGPARAMWRTELMMWDSETATNALAYLARRVGYKLKLSDLVETMEMMVRRKNEAARAEANRLANERGLREPRAYETPEWVWVWLWANNYRDPSISGRGFPQQGDWTDPRATMTTTEYEALHQEWVDAGSPHGKVKPLVKSL